MEGHALQYIVAWVDPEGGSEDVVFFGPYATEEQAQTAASMPGAIWHRLDSMQARRELARHG